MADPNKTVQGKLFSDRHLRLFGVDLRRAFALPRDDHFEDLLQALNRLDFERTKA
jgi:hypothetical protein